jgi:hypothetical protein
VFKQHNVHNQLKGCFERHHVYSLHYYGKVCLRRDVLTYTTDLFKTHLFRKLMIQHW